jgi:glucose-6-phosphate dehydrogenase assembly protein OpcA
MSTTIRPPVVGETVPVGLEDVEGELSRLVKAFQGSGEAPVLRARMSNLIVYCDRIDVAEEIAAEVPAIVAIHPARVVLAITESGGDGDDLTASVRVRAHETSDGRLTCSEQVTVHARGRAAGRLPFAVRGLLIGDLPTNLWWAPRQPPPLAEGTLYDLAEHAQQIIYDSMGWLEPARGVAATASWIARVERDLGEGPWRVVSDLNWRRLKYWRRLLAQALDPGSAPGAIESVTDLQVEHGPHAVVQAWQIASWLAARLGWRVHAGQVQPGLEICWQFTLPSRRTARVRIQRLAEGPPEVRRIGIACSIDGRPCILNLIPDGEHRLAVILEGSTPRTITVQPLPLSDLVARQLSDRDRDPIFHQCMTVAGVLAESVLG